MASVPPGYPPPPPPFPPPPPPAGGRSGPPWEGSAPFVQRFIDTAQGLAMDPNAFFGTMRLEGGLVNPLIYAVAGAAGAGLVSALIGAVLPFVSAAFFRHLVVVPCLTAVMLFVGSGIYHVVLMLLGGAKQPFEATFRVVAYTMGTTTWANVVPLCGGIVAAVWALVCLVLGLQRTHDVSTGTAVATVLIPAVVCVLAAITVAIFTVGMAMLGGALSGLFG